MSDKESRKSRRALLKSSVVGTGILSASGLAVADQSDEFHRGGNNSGRPTINKQRIKSVVENETSRDWVWVDELEPASPERYTVWESQSGIEEVFVHNEDVFMTRFHKESGTFSLRKVGDSSSVDAQSLAKEGQAEYRATAPDIIVDSGPICPEPECDRTGWSRELPEYCIDCCSACSGENHYYTGFWFELNKYADAAGKTALSAVLAYCIGKYLAGTVVADYISVGKISGGTGVIVDFIFNLASSKTYTISVEDADVAGQPVTPVAVALEKRATPDETVPTPLSAPGHYMDCSIF